MKKQYQKLSHTIYLCKYHIVFCPKYRYRIFEGEIAVYTDGLIRKLLSYKDHIEVLELNVQPDHIHLVGSIAPKYSVSNLMGMLKGRMATKLFQHYERLGRRYWGRHLWSRGYCVSTIGLDEDQIRAYVKWQEKKEKSIETSQLGLFNQ